MFVQFVVVASCGNKHDKNKPISFFSLPRNGITVEIWLNLCKKVNTKTGKFLI